MKSSQANNKAVGSKLDVLEQQTKQFIGERQGAWELHYSNQEIGLRKKADKNKELLQLHQTEAQVMVMVKANEKSSTNGRQTIKGGAPCHVWKREKAQTTFTTPHTIINQYDED